MAEVALQAEVRTGTGKGVARKLRAQGKVPAVMYGRGAEPLSLAVDARALQHTLATEAGMNVLIDLKIGNDTHLTLARQLDKNPVRGTLLHVDFVKIARDQKITADVPIHIEGDAPGVKEGGVLDHHLWQIHIESFPQDVPQRINVDVSKLNIGDSVHLGQLRPPEGVTFLTGEDELIVSCIVPQVLKVEAELEEGAVPEGEEAAEAAPAEGEAAAAPAEGAKEEG